MRQPKPCPTSWGNTRENTTVPNAMSLNFISLIQQRYGFPLATFSKIIREVIAKGFIDPLDKGGLKGDGKSYNKFRLSRRWEDYGKSGFEQIEWKCFLPKPRAKATSKREMKRHLKTKVNSVRLRG
jgi:hypothetical protein